MKYKVIDNFTDKYTGERYKIGDILELTKERANEILKVGKFLEEIKKPKKDK
jgi:hypothetical protein